MKYQTILCDPPWQQPLAGKYKKHSRAATLPYPTMTLDEIKTLPVQSLAADNCHLWLWTTNAFLRDGFDVMAEWGFKHLCPITWVKPSGCGNYFIHRTQVLLFGYRGRLNMQKRFLPNIIEAPARRHSQKPDVAYEMIEAVSSGPRLELFSRNERAGWTMAGNAIDGEDIRLTMLKLIDI